MLNFSNTQWVACDSCQGCYAGRYVIHADIAVLYMGFVMERIDATVEKMLAQCCVMLRR